jgi:hypothetical protein
MPKSRKNCKKNTKINRMNKTNRKDISRKGATKKCIYTYEAIRLLKDIKELRKKNEIRIMNESRKNIDIDRKNKTT